MKLINYITSLPILLVALLAMISCPLTAQVYKVVDEDGNVTYTDQAPGDGSQPIELRPISVIEAPAYVKPEKPDEESIEDGEGKEMSLRYLRKNYADFAIVAPRQEESVWQPDGGVTAAWNARYQLQPGMQVTISVDGQPQTTTSEQIVSLGGLDRGEHTVSAELKDAKNRSIASAGPVTFFVRQPGLYNNRPRPTPHGGG